MKSIETKDKHNQTLCFGATAPCFGPDDGVPSRPQKTTDTTVKLVGAQKRREESKSQN
jgi:hypothetical protein